MVLCALTLALAAGGTSAEARSVGPTTTTPNHAAAIAASTAAACQSITAPSVPGAAVQSISGVVVAAGTDPDPGGTPIPGVPEHCAVSLYLTHPGADDHVLVEVWLPTSGWNGSFEGTGGGGYVAGEFDTALAPAIEGGYAAASTDAGVGTDVLSPASWALNANGSVDQGLLTDFAYRSVHDMTVAAKAIVADYYGKTASYAYWNGCSTGGRQGLMEAQKYPTDYNGILAAAPAINWAEFIPSEFWPQVVMNEEKDYPTTCEFNAFTDAAIAACDKSDPADGGLVDNPLSCGFDPRSLIGKKVVCNGETLTITAADANVVRLIWQGPTAKNGRPLWHGLTKEAPFDGLALTTTSADGTAEGSPFEIASTWISYFLERDPSFNTATITYSQFVQLFNQSVREYGSIIGTNDPNLSAFEKAGGKMITWHGLADQLIFPQGTIDYYQCVQTATGGAQNVASFYRLFLAPGVQHCGAGNGPAPTDPLSSLVNWVEHGDAPNTLAASITQTNGTTVTRNLCAYPQQATYNGHGNADAASSYHCAFSPGIK
jgi:feruloyl esterase